MNKDCVFCKIVKGEEWSAKVYEDEGHVSFMDINPVSIGHLLVVPKKHYQTIIDMPVDDVSKLYGLVAKLARAVNEAFKPLGINILQNNGRVANQIIPHVHVHIAPRYGNEGPLFVGVKRIRVSKDELLDHALKINKQIR